MPTAERRLVACILATLTALGGVLVAVVAASVAATLADDGSFLSGLEEALFAGAALLVLTVVATIAVLRWWVSRGGAATLGWGWATLAATAGLVAGGVLWVATSILAEATADAVLAVGLPLAIAAAPAAAYGVLAGWAARSPSRG